MTAHEILDATARGESLDWEFPPESAARLRKLFGADFDTLSPIEVQTLVTADLEGEVSNSRLQLIRTEHPVELTKMLQSLTARGFLDQIGQKRGCSYRLPAWASSLMSGASPLVSGASSVTSGASSRISGAPPLAPGTPPPYRGNSSPCAGNSSP